MRGFSGSPVPAMDDQRYQSKNFFVYNVANPASLGAAGQVTLSFNVDGDSDFFWKYFSVIDGVTDSPTPPTANLLITNNTTGRQYSNVAVGSQAIAGTAGLPFILPMVTWFAAKSSISIQVQESSGSTIAALQLAFIGVKAFLRNSSG